MNRRRLEIEQLNSKMLGFASVKQAGIPPAGWIKNIRKALGMSMQQLGKKLSVSKQGILDMEKREAEGSITIRSLKETARVLDMQLVYGFVPNDGSLDALIEKKATDLARKIVLRVSNSMVLEDQGISGERIEKAIQERAEIIKNEMPKILWD